MHHEVHGQGRQREDLENHLYDTDELARSGGPCRIVAVSTAGQRGRLPSLLHTILMAAAGVAHRGVGIRHWPHKTSNECFRDVSVRCASGKVSGAQHRGNGPRTETLTGVAKTVASPHEPPQPQIVCDCQKTCTCGLKVIKTQKELDLIKMGGCNKLLR